MDVAQMHMALMTQIARAAETIRRMSDEEIDDLELEKRVHFVQLLVTSPRRRDREQFVRLLEVGGFGERWMDRFFDQAFGDMCALIDGRYISNRDYIAQMIANVPYRGERQIVAASTESTLRLLMSEQTSRRIASTSTSDYFSEDCTWRVVERCYALHFLASTKAFRFSSSENDEDEALFATAFCDLLGAGNALFSHGGSIHSIPEIPLIEQGAAVLDSAAMLASTSDPNTTHAQRMEELGYQVVIRLEKLILTERHADLLRKMLLRMPRFKRWLRTAHETRSRASVSFGFMERNDLYWG